MRRHFERNEEVGPPLRLALLLVVATLTSTAYANSEPGSTPQRAILDQFEVWEEAAAREDASELASIYTEDAIFLPPGAPPVEGREAIAAMMRQQFEAADLEVDFTTEEIVVEGDWAFRRGSYVARGTLQASGESISSHDRFLEIWRRGEDGKWRIARDIWNAAPSAAP